MLSWVGATVGVLNNDSKVAVHVGKGVTVSCNSCEAAAGAKLIPESSKNDSRTKE